MQATDPFHSGPSLLAEGGVPRLKERLAEMRPEIGREEWKRIQELVADPERDHESIRDSVSTRLMEVFKGARARQEECRGAFGLLYELNGQHLLTQVAARLRRYSSKADPRDVLQEVFFNVYRYPHRFNSAREDAFRVWSAMIVRNTVLKHLRSLSRGGRNELNFEDVPEQSSGENDSPVAGAIETESRDECARVFVTYLQLYLQFYSMLSERERRALHLVEVDEQSYRQASEELGIKLENLKMVIFRARRKILRSLDAVQSRMEAWSPAEVGGQRLDAMAPTAMHRIERAQRASRASRQPSMEAGA
ncbi:MAG: sigma-70 family RNA polymerase sigma factor [Planctomycetes bacterium]|nr:sigma-70 family RNA polymerase sigma factor [Planctomycetota bacterium]